MTVAGKKWTMCSNRNRSLPCQGCKVNQSRSPPLLTALQKKADLCSRGIYLCKSVASFILQSCAFKQSPFFQKLVYKISNICKKFRTSYSFHYFSRIYCRISRRLQMQAVFWRAKKNCAQESFHYIWSPEMDAKVEYQVVGGVSNQAKNRAFIPYRRC